MEVADLCAGGAGNLAGRGGWSLHETNVGEGILDTGKARDVVELVEQGESEDAPDAGDGLEEFEGVGTVDLGADPDVLLHGSDYLVEAFGQGNVGLDVARPAESGTAGPRRSRVRRSRSGPEGAGRLS
jgi:hypothetical protein